MRRSSVKEYAEIMRRHYSSASRAEMGRFWDEFVKVTCYHRKSTVRVLYRRRYKRSVEG